MYYALVTIDDKNVESVWELTDDPRDALREFKNHNPNIPAYTRKATREEITDHIYELL